MVHFTRLTHTIMEWNRTANTPTYTPQTDAALHQIPNWNTTYNSSSNELRRYNISHFIEFQASVMIWRYVAPIILVVGTIGSILSLLVLCRKSLRIQTTMFYLSALAITDLMVLYAGLVRLWLEHAENTYIRLSSRAACKVHNFFVYLSLDLSVWILVAVSVDRCLYVSWPQVAKKWCKLRNARIIVSIITVLCALINVHFIWTYDLEMTDSQHIYANGNKKCYADTSSSLTVSFVMTIWPWIDFCVYCLFPFLFMATSNAIIIKQLLRTERNMASYQNFPLEGGQRMSAEQGLDRLKVTSTSTSMGQRSDTGSDQRASKHGELNQLGNDTLHHSMSKLSRKSSGDLPAVKVDATSETEAEITLSQNVWLSDGVTPKSLNVSKSVKYAESSVAFVDFKEYVAPKVKTIRSGNCQSITASNKRSSMKHQKNPEPSGTSVLESREFDFLNAQTMSNEGEADDEPHLSVTKKTSEGSCSAESRLRIQSQFDSGEPRVLYSHIQSHPTELEVIDELTDVTPANLTASFHDEHVETKIILPEIQTQRVDTRWPKSTERMRTLTNKVHPLQHNHQAISTDMSSVSIRGALETAVAVPRTFCVANNNEKNRLVNESQRDSSVTRSELYEMSHAEPVIYTECTPFNNNTKPVSKSKPVEIENIGTDVDNTSPYHHENISTDVDNNSHYHHEIIGTDVDNKSHYHHENIGTDVDNKSHYHHENIGTDVDNKSHYHHENIGTDVDNKSHYHHENISTDVDNKSHYHHENIGTDVDNKSHYHHENISTDVDNKSHYHHENIGTDVDNKSHYHHENISTDVDNKSHYHHENIGTDVDNNSHYHHEIIGTDVDNKSHYHHENIGTDVDNKSHYHHVNNDTDVINKAHYHHENIDTDVDNKSHYHHEITDTSVINKLRYHHENIDTAVDNKSQFHYENIDTDVINKSHYHHENIGTDADDNAHFHHANIDTDIDINSHYHSEKTDTDVVITSHNQHEHIDMDVDNKSQYHHENTVRSISSTCSATSPAINQPLGLPKKSLSPSRNKWQSTSTTSDTLTTVPSRRNTGSVSKTLLAVTIMFWVFNAPIVIFIIGQTYIITAADDRGRAVLILGWTIVNILQYMNNALHFFLYCLTGPKFRQELKDLFKECFAIIKRVKSLMHNNK